MSTTTVPSQPITQPAVAAPTSRGDRIVVIDVLRGFALCGILLIHVPVFSRPGAPPGLNFTNMNFDGAFYNELVLYALIWLVEGKFFSLFSALFGVGFALQWQRAQAKNRPFVPLFRRRLFFLGLFGAAHIVLLWEGDILLLYAVVGLLLIPFREAPNRKLLRWALGLLIVPLIFYALAFMGLALARLDAASAALLRAGEIQFVAEFSLARNEVIRRYASADVGYTILQRTLAYVQNTALLLTRVPPVLAMFLLGFYVGKRDILQNVEEYLPLLRRVRTWGLVGGLITGLLVMLAYSELRPFAALTSLAFNQVLAGPLLAFGYAAALILLVRRGSWAARLQPLAAYGRMALTVYLSQSAICALLFYGYGFGLVLDVPPLQAVGLALVINAVLIAFAVQWLKHFRYGPLEWLWRSLTYGQMQRFRRNQ